MKLQEWLNQQNMSCLELSRRIGYQSNYLYKIIAGKSSAGKRLGQEMEKFTEGAVTRADLGYKERVLCRCPTCGAYLSRKKAEAE